MPVQADSHVLVRALVIKASKAYQAAKLISLSALLFYLGNENTPS